MIRSLYDFFMNRKVKKQLTKEDYPETDLMREAKVLNRDPIEDFMIDFSSNDELLPKIYTIVINNIFKQVVWNSLYLCVTFK